jgi:hypothetical protein
MLHCLALGTLVDPPPCFIQINEAGGVISKADMTDTTFDAKRRGSL